MSECQMAELLELLSDRVTVQSEILDRQSRLLAGMERRLRTLEALAARASAPAAEPETGAAPKEEERVSDKDFDCTAQYDQMGAHLASMAQVLGQFNRALTKEGFTQEDAMVFLEAYFHSLFPPKKA